MASKGPGGMGQPETHDGIYRPPPGNAPGKVPKGDVGGDGSARVIADVNRKAPMAKGQGRRSGGTPSNKS